MKIENELRKALDDEVSHLVASPLLLDGVRRKRHRRIVRTRVLAASVVTALVVAPLVYWNLSGPSAPTPPVATPSPHATATYEPGSDFERLDEYLDLRAPVTGGGEAGRSVYVLSLSCVGTAKVKFTFKLLDPEHKEQVLQCPGATHFTYKPRMFCPNYLVTADLVGPGTATVSWKLFGKKNKAVGTN
jgi:hypothetical protein